MLNEFHASPSGRDAGASVGTDAGACTGGLVSWTGLLGIPWKNATILPSIIHSVLIVLSKREHIHILQGLQAVPHHLGVVG